MELREALDSSENTVLVLERENAAQKQTADARQMKQVLEKAGKIERSHGIASRKNEHGPRSRSSAKMPHRSKLPMPGRRN